MICCLSPQSNYSISNNDLNSHENSKPIGICGKMSQIWDSLVNFPYPQLITRIQMRSNFELICNSAAGHGSYFKMINLSGFSFGKKVIDAACRALSSVKHFFCRYTLIQKIIQAPRLLSSINMSFGLYSLVGSAKDFLGATGKWEKFYALLDIVEHLGTFGDGVANFLIGLVDIHAIPHTVLSIAAPIAYTSIGLSILSMLSKGVMLKQLVDWEQDLAGKEKTTNALSFFQALDDGLLTKVFKVEGATIKKNIQAALNTDKEGPLLESLKGRLQSRIRDRKLSLLVDVISVIGMAVLFVSPFSVVAYITLIATAVLAVKQSVDEYYSWYQFKTEQTLIAKQN